MRIKPALVVGMLVTLPGLAAAFTTAPTSARPSPDRLELVDPEGLTPSEWVRAMILKNSPVDLTDANFTSLEVPYGHTIVGQVIEGVFTLSVVPDADVASPPTTQGALGVEPGRDCLNDKVDAYYGSSFPLAGNILYPAAPNIASAGMCDTYSGLDGPVNYLTFRSTGNRGGGLSLSSIWDYYAIGCTSPWGEPAAAMAGAGAGVGSQFQNTLQVENSHCEITQYGLQPSAWAWHLGSVWNWNNEWGDTYASTATSGVPLGDVP